MQAACPTWPLDQRCVAEVVFDLTLYHRVGIRTELGLRVKPVAVDGLHQTDVADLEKVLVGLLRTCRVPADHVVQDSGVQREDALDRPPVTPLPVSFDQAYDRVAGNTVLSWSRYDHRTPSIAKAMGYAYMPCGHFSSATWIECRYQATGPLCLLQGPRLPGKAESAISKVFR